jgi:hypothetical protein
MISALSASVIVVAVEFGGGRGFRSIAAISVTQSFQVVYVISMKVESNVQSARAFVLNKQAALGSSPFKEGHTRQRFAWINDYLIRGVGEIAAAKVATIQADISPLRIAPKQIYADSQA